MCEALGMFLAMSMCVGISTSLCVSCYAAAGVSAPRCVRPSQIKIRKQGFLSYMVMSGGGEE